MSDGQREFVEGQNEEQKWHRNFKIRLQVWFTGESHNSQSLISAAWRSFPRRGGRWCVNGTISRAQGCPSVLTPYLMVTARIFSELHTQF